VLGAVLPLHDVRYLSDVGRHVSVTGPRSRISPRPFGLTASAIVISRTSKSSINPAGGARRDRTDDLLLAKQALSQLSYGPMLELVGLGRLELPTSRLSSARSNQLSYKPGSLRSFGPAARHPDQGSGVQSKTPNPDIRKMRRHGARPRRKRNVDGGVPPMDAPILKTNAS
jgi:hypothetical protein